LSSEAEADKGEANVNRLACSSLLALALTGANLDRAAGQAPASNDASDQPTVSGERGRPAGLSRGHWVDPNTDEPAGTRYKTFHSRTIDGDVSYLVYLPPDYET
jgi:hypothetical protein